MQELQVDWNEQMIDLKHRTILPCFVDSHTHMVFASGRQEEFVMKIKGASYEDIAAAGGGILNSAKNYKRPPLNNCWKTHREGSPLPLLREPEH